jgi:hypothetical protein
VQRYLHFSAAVRRQQRGSAFAITVDNHYSRFMKTNVEDRQRYRIKDFHRNQAFVALLKKDPNTYAWIFSGHIDFEDGHEITFNSQRGFTTHLEAEAYMRQFARAHIDSRLRGTQQF